MINWVLYFSTGNDRAYILLEKAGTDVKIALNNDLMAPRTGTHTQCHQYSIINNGALLFLFTFAQKNIY